MARAVILLFASAAVALAAGALEPRRGPCDVKLTEPAIYCPKEERKIPDGNATKEGKCANDGVDIRKIELCVKKHYVCNCPASGCCPDDKLRPGNCKCARPLQEELDRCLVLWACDGCAAKSPAKDIVKHDEKKCKEPAKATYKKTCEKSGKFPHGS